MISFAEILGHATYLILAASYWAKDMLWLRLLTIPACLCGLSFGLLYPEGPIWVIVFWNALFLGINLVQINRIFAGSHVRIDDDAKVLFDLLKPIRQRDVKLLIRNGIVSRFSGAQNESDGALLILEGHQIKHLFVILHGNASISKNEQHIANCGPGTFLGDISFVTDAESSATVRLSPGAVTIAWQTDQLNRLLDSNPDLRSSFTRHLAIEISRKLQRNEAGLQTSAV